MGDSVDSFECVVSIVSSFIWLSEVCEEGDPRGNEELDQQCCKLVLCFIGYESGQRRGACAIYLIATTLNQSNKAKY